MAENGARLAAMPEATGGSSLNGGLPDILEAIWRQHVLVLFVTLAALVLGAVAVNALPQRYTATAQITIDPRGLQVVANELTPRDSAGEAQASVIDTELRVIVSNLVLGEVVSAQNLDSDPEFLGQTSLGGRVRTYLRGQRVRGPDERHLVALEALRGKVRTLRPAGTYAVQISVDTLQAEKSARLAQAVIATYIERKLNQRRDSLRRASKELVARLGDLQARVAQAEGAVEAYKRENMVMGADRRLNNEQQLGEVTSQLTNARRDVSEREARAAQVLRSAARPGSVGDDLPETVQSATITQLRTQYTEAQRQLDGLGRTLGAQHPNLAALRAQAESVRGQIAAELRRIAQSLLRDLERAQENEQRLLRESERLVTEGFRVNSALVRLRELEREAQTQRAIYEAFLTRSRELVEQEGIDTSNITVISPATVPLNPDGASRFLILVVAGALGLSLGAAGALARDRVDDRVRHPADLDGLGLPTLAQLPILRLGPYGPGPATLDIYDGSTPQGREAVLSLYRLLDAVPDFEDKRRPKVVSVLSSDADPGCSTVALNLALTFGADGWRVLLVDANHNEAVLTAVFRAVSGPNLDDVISGRSTLQQAASSVASGYDLAFLGTTPSWEVGLRLSSKALEEFLVLPASNRFDLILLDGGQARRNPSLRGVAGVADAILLTVRQGKTRVRALRHLHDLLGAAADKVVGAVLLATTRNAEAQRAARDSLPGRGGAMEASKLPHLRAMQGEGDPSAAPPSRIAALAGQASPAAPAGEGGQGAAARSSG